MEERKRGRQLEKRGSRRGRGKGKFNRGTEREIEVQVFWEPASMVGLNAKGFAMINASKEQRVRGQE